MSEPFGLTVFTPVYSFQAELSRDHIVAIVSSKDNPNQLRIEEDSIITNTPDRESVVEDIAYSFMYIYIKHGGSIGLKVRGIIAACIENDFYFSVASNDDDYTNASRLIKSLG